MRIMTDEELAKHIKEYLVSFQKENGDFYQDPQVYAVGGKIVIQYIGGWIPYPLSRDSAIEYFSWLALGNVGRHFSCGIGEDFS